MGYANGFCQCGCGEKTKLASQNDSRTGSIKGQPLRFIHGHNNANWKGGKSLGRTNQKYTISLNHKHPKGHNGYVLEHRLIAEKVLGKYLPQSAVVHHINGDTFDNRNQNLVICENDSYHQLLHRRKIALKECGHADWRKCCFCHEYDNPINLIYNKMGRNSFHRICKNNYKKQWREKQCNSAV